MECAEQVLQCVENIYYECIEMEVGESLKELVRSPQSNGLESHKDKSSNFPGLGRLDVLALAMNVADHFLKTKIELLLLDPISAQNAVDKQISALIPATTGLTMLHRAISFVSG